MDVTLNFITRTAYQLIQLSPQPAPYFRILRDVLRLPPDDLAYQATQQRLYQNRHAVELAQTQEENGTWGRFHTQDTSIKKKFITTEVAIKKALANAKHFKTVTVGSTAMIKQGSAVEFDLKITVKK